MPKVLVADTGRQQVLPVMRAGDQFAVADAYHRGF